MLFGLVVFGAATLAASLAATPAPLIVCRGIMGFGAAFVMPSTLSVITSVFRRAKRARRSPPGPRFAGAGGALGPLLSGVVLQAYSGTRCS
ncbi:MAG: MFS transporter [Candidatus Microthrix sp.]|nr:MFS transporter [Candidatus Microthrix sp.]